MRKMFPENNETCFEFIKPKLFDSQPARDITEIVI